MDTDLVRISRCSLHVSEAWNHGDSHSPSCVTFENPVHTQIYDRSTESPKSHGKVSMCLDKDNLNNSTTNIASVSDNRLSSHNDIMIRELM